MVLRREGTRPGGKIFQPDAGDAGSLEIAGQPAGEVANDRRQRADPQDIQGRRHRADRDRYRPAALRLMTRPLAEQRRELTPQAGVRRGYAWGITHVARGLPAIS